jgi:hypothetical protein
VVVRELGHGLGLDDTPGGGLMRVFLATGTRQLPTALGYPAGRTVADTYFIDLAPASQATSSVADGDAPPSPTFGLSLPFLLGSTDQVVDVSARMFGMPASALARAARAPADDWGTDVVTWVGLWWHW